MKIVCFSDTHGYHDRIEIPAGDVLVFAGDMNASSGIQEIIKFAKFIEKQPHKHKIIVPGNHDWEFQTITQLALNEFTNSIVLIDSEETINGLLFYGSPWQPEFQNWAFNLPRGGEELQRKWKMIPDATDVLITHCPPNGILDTVWNGGDHIGCNILRYEIETRVKPKAHIFGHIHGGYGIKEVDGTVFVNCSICTEDYRPANKPIVIEI